MHVLSFKELQSFQMWRVIIFLQSKD